VKQWVIESFSGIENKRLGIQNFAVQKMPLEGSELVLMNSIQDQNTMQLTY